MRLYNSINFYVFISSNITKEKYVPCYIWISFHHLPLFLDPFRKGLSCIKPSKILQQFCTAGKFEKRERERERERERIWMIKKEKCMKSGILCHSYKLRKFTRGENWLNKKVQDERNLKYSLSMVAIKVNEKEKF